MRYKKTFRLFYSIAMLIAVAVQLSRPTRPAGLGNFAPAVNRSSDSLAAEPHFATDFLHNDPGVMSVHAGTVEQLPNGQLMAAWFGGTREGAKDVCIYAAVKTHSGWSNPKVIMTRQQATRDLDLYVKKLGNPVLFVDSNKRLWMYFVAVSVGGWSGSFIASTHSDDSGMTWTPAKRLITSPTLNISTMVKAQPLETDAGLIAVPIYHECINVFSELLWLDRQGTVICKDRITQQNGTLQPSLLLDGSKIRAYHRRCWDTPRRVLTSAASPPWNSWSEVTATNVPNSGSAVAALNRHDSGFVMIANPIEYGRSQLSICVSDDGLKWRKVFDLEAGAKGEGYSYPYMIQGNDDDYHVIYTWKRERMKHATFNEAWLRGL